MKIHYSNMCHSKASFVPCAESRKNKATGCCGHPYWCRVLKGMSLHAVKKDRGAGSEAEEKQRQETERKLQEEAQRKADEERAAQLGKPDAEEVAPGEPAGDHITAAEPANAQGMRLHISESTLRLAE